MLEGQHTSCHRLRLVLVDYPPHLPLSTWTSCSLTTNILIDILSYFASTANNALAPYREQLQAVADINPAPTWVRLRIPGGCWVAGQRAYGAAASTCLPLLPRHA